MKKDKEAFDIRLKFISAAENIPDLLKVIETKAMQVKRAKGEVKD
jgi:hypothetical protein